ncbi:hypothetical protein C8Q78DRAFT_1070593 [Trametes maxima]|nr:hypothetical protein C8Q78DRAFT_1070593 [Trametes maxima]
MPADRGVKMPLRQATLFSFAKPIPPKTAKQVAASGTQSTTDEQVALDASEDAQSPTKPPKIRRRQSLPTPQSKKKPKAGHEDRVESDVVLSIKPEFTKLISERKKNHEYRKYKLKEEVCRLWLYETAPTSAITYVMETSRPKVPGEVNDPSGIGNDDFDKGLKQSKYGYPVTGLYKLRKPLTTLELKERFDIAVPQGWRYATRKLVDEAKLEDMKKLF